MGRFLLESASYGPDALKLLGQAFDEAWQEIAGNYGDAMVVDRRNRLALAILQIADTGERDVARLKDAALQAMKRTESPLPFIRGSQRTHRHG
jgi:hypothetical protein